MRISLLFLLIFSLNNAQEINFEDIQGIPTECSKAIIETTDAIMQRQEEVSRSQLESPKKIFRVRGETSRRFLPCNPNSPEIASFPHSQKITSEEELPADQLRAQTISSINFTATTLSQTQAFPPDSMGAVGPKQFIIAVNGRIKSFNKKTGDADGVLNVDPDVFFQSVRKGKRTSDPRIRYDRFSQRWFILIINIDIPNRILLAVSDSSIITNSTAWQLFFIDQDLVQPAGNSDCIFDYPTLGIDENALYIGGNMFCGVNEVYNGTAAFVVRKSSVLDSGPLVISVFRNLTGSPSGSGPFTPQGVDNFDSNPTHGFFIGVDNATFGTLALRIVSDPGGTPSLSNNIFLTVTATSFPLLVPHLGNNNGTTGYLDGIDDRLMMAQIRKEKLWTVHNIGTNNNGIASGTTTRNGSRWYQIKLANPSAPVLRQAGTLFQSTSSNTTTARNYWMPSIMVSGQGHALLGCSTAGKNEHINAALAFRISSNSLGTLKTPKLYTSSSTAYNPPGDPGSNRGRRWGDYSYTSLDPADDMTMWTIQEFCDATNSYGIRVVKVIAPPPAKLRSATPSKVARGRSSVNVTIKGRRFQGAGFFDPGAGFDKRIKAKVTGGVIVNSITYINRKKVVLNLNTQNATPGLKTITIINPDKQKSQKRILEII